MYNSTLLCGIIKILCKGVLFVYLKDLFKEFDYELQVKNYSVRTVKSYRNNNLKFFRYLESEFEIEQLEQIRANHIKSYMLHLKQSGRKETYINGIFKTVRAFFRFCEEEEYVEERDNPIYKVKWMKEKTPVIKTFNDDEIRRMIDVFHAKDYLNLRNKLIIMMFADTGIRCLELCNITHNDVFDTTIKINGKGNRERYIYISQMLKKYLIKYERIKPLYFKDRFVKHNNFFLSFTGQPLTVNGIEYVIKNAGKKANVRPEIRCSPHTIRHYFSQKMLETSDIYSVSRLLGHEDTSITKRYLQSMEDTKILDMSRSNSPLMNLNRG